MKRLLIVAFFFEIGFALLVVPWSAFWDRNYFAEAVPVIHTVITGANLPREAELVIERSGTALILV